MDVICSVKRSCCVFVVHQGAAERRDAMAETRRNLVIDGVAIEARIWENVSVEGTWM